MPPRARRIGTGNAAARRDLSAVSCNSFFLLSSSPIYFLPLPSPLFLASLFSSARARYSVRGKSPAEMRRAATREWNIIARRGITLFLPFFIFPLPSPLIPPSVSTVSPRVCSLLLFARSSGLSYVFLQGLPLLIFPEKHDCEDKCL